MSQIQLSGSEMAAVQELCKIAADLTGVQLTDRHQIMITSRLQKRLVDLKLNSLSEYLMFYRHNRHQEDQKLISLLTTHHTYFFREYSHFEFLLSDVLPPLLPLILARPDKTIRIWAAACSRGQEVYSLAMFLDFHLKKINPSLKYEILGTDIDSESIAIANNGVYFRSELKSAPLSLVADHWAKGSGEIEAYVKAKKSIRQFCSFRPANLLELKAGSEPNEKFDIIFCRNVFIYFNSQQIKAITQQFITRLAPAGFLFVGISESLNSLGLALKTCGPSVYRHQSIALDKSISKVKESTPVRSVPMVSKQTPIRVLCVDDSPVILTLLKQILSDGGKNEFEVVGTAVNGIDAAKKVQELRPDVMTLDIHMPEQTGIEYLEKNFKSGHPPVIMVTSVAREDSSLAGKALSLGAADYVEKPALSNLPERGEEIRTKLRCALLSSNTGVTHLGLDRAFQTKGTVSVERADEKLRVVCFSLSARERVKNLLKEFQGDQPSCVLMVEGGALALPAVADYLTRETGKKVQYSENSPTQFEPNTIFLVDLASSVDIVQKTALKKETSVLVFGELAKLSAERLLLFRGAHLVLEDLGGGKGSQILQDVANDIVLSTSFSYLSDEYFCKLDQRKKKAA